MMLRALYVVMHQETDAGGGYVALLLLKRALDSMKKYARLEVLLILLEKFYVIRIVTVEPVVMIHVMKIRVANSL